MNYTYFVELSNIFFLIFIIGSSLSTIFDSLLSYCSSRTDKVSVMVKKLATLHTSAKKYFTRSKITRAFDYQNEHDNLSSLEGSISGGISSLFLMLGVVPFMIHGLMILFPSMSLTCVLSIVIPTINIIRTLCTIPFDYYRTMVIDNKFKMNNMSVRMFISDFIKRTVLSTLVLVGLINLGNYIFTAFGPFSISDVWKLFLGVTATGLIFEFLYTTVFIRMFNKLTPLKNKKLNNKIVKLLKQLGMENSKIYVMDASKRSNATNAFVTGFGSSKKIVLFDNLIKKYSENEIASVLAHELGHSRLNHLSIQRVLSAAELTISLIIIVSFMYNPSLFHAFGYSWITTENVAQYGLIGFTLMHMVVGSIKWILDPVYTYISRRCEYSADAFAVKAMKSGEGLTTALIRLTSENFANPIPDPTYEKLTYSHPSIINRINAINNVVKSLKKSRKKRESKSNKKD